MSGLLKLTSTAGGSILAREDMFYFDPSFSKQGALASPFETGCSLTVWGVHLASSPRLPAAACRGRLATEFLQANFAPDHTRCLSILDQGAVCQLFSSCCRDQHVDPECCFVSILLKYLQMLLDNVLSVATMKFYVASILARNVICLLSQSLIVPNCWSPCSRLTSYYCRIRLPFPLLFLLRRELVSFMSCPLPGTPCTGNLKDLELPCGPTPHFLLRGSQLYTLISQFCSLCLAAKGGGPAS